jgi:MFS family permease
VRIMRPRPAGIVFGLLCAMYFILYVDRVNIATVAPIVRAELGLSNTQLGLVFSAFAIPYALFQLLGGWIADRWGARFTLSACCAIVAAATVLTSMANGFAALFVLRIVLGFGEGAAFPTATRAMTGWMPEARWGSAQGITHAFARLGNALTPPIITGLLLWTSWRGSFVIVGLLSLVWLIAWACFFRNDPREHPAMTAADLARLPARAEQFERASAAAWLTVEAGRAGTPGRPRIPWLRLARRMLPVTAVNFCYGWTLWLFLSWIPAFFFENYHLNLKSTAMFSAGVLFAGVIGDTVGGLLSDWLLRKTGSLRVARCSVLAAGQLGAILFLIPVVLKHNLTVAATCLSLAFLFAELTVGPLWSVPMDISPRYAGSASGIMNFGFGIAGLISPSSFGYLVDRTGSWVFPFIGSIVLLLLGVVLAARLRPDVNFDNPMA